MKRSLLYYRIRRMEKALGEQAKAARNWIHGRTEAELIAFMTQMCLGYDTMIPRKEGAHEEIAPAFLEEYRAMLLKMDCIRPEGERWAVNAHGWYGMCPNPTWVLI